MPMSTHSLSPASKGSSMPSPTRDAAGLAGALVGRLHRARPAAGDHGEPGLDERAADLARLGVVRVVGRGPGRAEHARSPGPSSASAPKPSTNSAWIRSTRHGSVWTQSRRAARVEQPLVGGGLVDLLAPQRHRALDLVCRHARRPASVRSCRSQRSMCATGTCSSCLWASIGSPGPKLTAGTPRALNRATSVQPNFGFDRPRRRRRRTPWPPAARARAAPRGRCR